jgi:hypothetical protein
MGWWTTAELADALGWAAAALTLLTFVSGEMRRLRLLALAANAAFIGYGALAGLLPVLALHLTLVPVNLWRLNQTYRSTRYSTVQTKSPLPRRPRSWAQSRRARRVHRAQGGPPPACGKPQRAGGRPSPRRSIGVPTAQHGGCSHAGLGGVVGDRGS